MSPKRSSGRIAAKSKSLTSHSSSNNSVKRSAKSENKPSGSPNKKPTKNCVICQRTVSNGERYYCQDCLHIPPSSVNDTLKQKLANYARGFLNNYLEGYTVSAKPEENYIDCPLVITKNDSELSMNICIEVDTDSHPNNNPGSSSDDRKKNNQIANLYNGDCTIIRIGCKKHQEFKYLYDSIFSLVNLLVSLFVRDNLKLNYLFYLNYDSEAATRESKNKCQERAKNFRYAIFDGMPLFVTSFFELKCKQSKAGKNNKWINDPYNVFKEMPYMYDPKAYKGKGKLSTSTYYQYMRLKDEEDNDEEDNEYDKQDFSEMGTLTIGKSTFYCNTSILLKTVPPETMQAITSGKIFAVQNGEIYCLKNETSVRMNNIKAGSRGSIPIPEHIDSLLTKESLVRVLDYKDISLHLDGNGYPLVSLSNYHDLYLQNKNYIMEINRLNEQVSQLQTQVTTQTTNVNTGRALKTCAFDGCGEKHKRLNYGYISGLSAYTQQFCKKHEEGIENISGILCNSETCTHGSKGRRATAIFGTEIEGKRLFCAKCKPEGYVIIKPKKG